MKTYVGVDLGGTYVRAAIVDEKGNILEVQKAPSHARENAEIIMKTMKELVHSLHGLDDANAIGICVPGPVSRDGTHMTMATNIPPLKDYPLKDEMEKEFNKPVVLGNDADAAGLAEALVGAGKMQRMVVYITLSTGIGGAAIYNGQILPGAHGCEMEVASMSVDASRPHVNLPASGAVEDWASGTAVTRRGNEAFGEGTIKHAGMVFEKAAAGDGIAMKIADEVENDLAVMFANLAVTFDPDVFVIGGGMMKSADIFLPKVISKYMARALPAVRNTPFKKAALDEPGVVGAAMLPMSIGK